MKKYIHVIMFLKLVGLQILFSQAGQESIINPKDNYRFLSRIFDFFPSFFQANSPETIAREEEINQYVAMCPDIVEGLNIVRKKNPKILNFCDFLHANLSQGHEEANFAELHCQSQDCIIDAMKRPFLFTLANQVRFVKHTMNMNGGPEFKYVLEHVDGFMKYPVQDWIYTWKYDNKTLYHEAIELG